MHRGLYRPHRPMYQLCRCCCESPLKFGLGKKTNDDPARLGRTRAAHNLQHVRLRDCWRPWRERRVGNDTGQPAQ